MMMKPGPSSLDGNFLLVIYASVVMAGGCWALKVQTLTGPSHPFATYGRFYENLGKICCISFVWLVEPSPQRHTVTDRALKSNILTSGGGRLPL